MPSLRQRMSTYLRQLSFIADPKENDATAPHGCFITKYLEGKMGEFSYHSDITHGKEPDDLPNLQLKPYNTGLTAITASCTGPDEGLTSVKRSRLHLSAGPDIDFIDINQDQDLDVRGGFSSTEQQNRKLSRTRKTNKSIDSKVSQENEPKNENKTTVNAYKYSSTKFGYQQKINKTKKQQKQLDNVENNNLNVKNENVSLPETENVKPKLDVCENVVLNSYNLRKQSKTDEEGASNLNVTAEDCSKDATDSIINVINWNRENESACGLSVSLYEKNAITSERAGNPIADCYGLVVRGDASAMSLADGVNWGEGAKLAARSAVLGSLEYLDTAVFGQVPGGMATTTNEVFVSLLRCFGEAHDCILEVNGALSTLTVAVVLPLGGNHSGKYVICACNVGDSLGYVYSQKNGVKEFTQGSHDITSMRDMRDALGALGPVHGNKPELSNLTLSMTIVEPGDIVFLTSDGLSDNFDPVVGKFVEPFSAEAIKLVAANKYDHPMNSRPTRSAAEKKDTSHDIPKSSKSSAKSAPLSQQQQNTNRIKSLPPVNKKLPIENKNNVPPTRSGASNTNALKRQKFIRSNTVIEPRMNTSKLPSNHIPKSISGLPLVTAQQRQTLTLLRIEDLLCYGINNVQQPRQTAKNLCHILINFATMITAAKRKILEQRELFYRLHTDHSGVKTEMELTKLQQRSARKRVVESPMFSSLPGKLDHASIVAFTIGAEQAIAIEKETRKIQTQFKETDF